MTERRFTRLGITIGAVLLAAYAVVMLWPYLAATLVRGAALAMDPVVVAWLDAVRALIVCIIMLCAACPTTWSWHRIDREERPAPSPSRSHWVAPKRPMSR